MFVWHHNSLLITQYFSHYLWATYLSPSTAFFFLLQYPNSPNLVKKKNRSWRPNQWKKLVKEEEEKKKKRNPEQTEPVKEDEEKKKELNSQPRKKKSQKVVKSCSWILFVGPLRVFNYNISIELWVMETENNQNVFSVSITHNSKIRELSYENKVVMCQTNIELWILPFLSYEL